MLAFAVGLGRFTRCRAPTRSCSASRFALVGCSRSAAAGARCSPCWRLLAARARWRCCCSRSSSWSDAPLAAAAFCARSSCCRWSLRILYHGRGHFPFPWERGDRGAVCSAALLIVSDVEALRGIFAAWLAFVLARVRFPSQSGRTRRACGFMALPLRAARRCASGPLWVAVALSALGPRTTCAARVELREGKGRRSRTSARTGLQRLRSCTRTTTRITVSTRSTPSAHWEAVYLPEAGFPITRGWYRQDDFPRTRSSTRTSLSRRAYVRWLRARGVRYVLVPGDRLDYSSSANDCRAQAALRHEARRRLDLRGAAGDCRSRPARTVLRHGHERVTVACPRGPLRAEDPRARRRSSRRSRARTP